MHPVAKTAARKDQPVVPAAKKDQPYTDDEINKMVKVEFSTCNSLEEIKKMAEKLQEYLQKEYAKTNANSSNVLVQQFRTATETQAGIYDFKQVLRYLVLTDKVGFFANVERGMGFFVCKDVDGDDKCLSQVVRISDLLKIVGK